MAEVDKVKERIAELANRRKNVTLQEIEWVVKQLGINGFETSCRTATHNRLFRVGTRRFAVCCHNPGSRQVKGCYVDEFLDAMSELGLYEK